ncbi:zinc-dependent alcohol dehydrogenase family protein [Paracoccus alkanivorans]|uniref:NAD(P)-dependent alcohol dehydrogenase n=1 Tax=Paracoccus alkanivorans TaxID=2116655 RepID=A0A3M0MNT4_9RHOB|nr:NAD(P)-dependent alcohol dehydrogenase [Paracoccus alkanivorans]RMC37984.1 NAD(P)-dependent alcohol dehydrogenase [Paracoccus alkanivorans]
MRLVRLKAQAASGNLKLVEAEPRSPGPGEVLVRIRACSLNAHDSMVIGGLIPTADGRIPLSDGAGEVMAIGESVDAFKIGDAVVSTFFPAWFAGNPTKAVKRDIPGETIDGYASEFACRPAHHFTKAPAHSSYLESATLPCAGVTAWSGLMTHGQVKPGETVLVLGSGGVSLFALQFAKMVGARLIATSSSEDKLAQLQRLGADEVINYKECPAWGRKAKELTDGRGVDHVVEVGGPGTIMQSIEACRMGGHIAVIGVLTGFSGDISIPAIFSNQIRITGIQVGSRAEQASMIRAINANALKPVIGQVYPFEEINDAFADFDAGKSFGKACMEF